tara:strand:- start:35 stop:601 length:567 start_codon:yes stop_codon:yes gene_type:complete
MAHRPVGTGVTATFAAAGTAKTTAAFQVQSNSVRIVPVGTAVNVAIGTDPVATTSDYYIPSGGSAVLAMTKASQAVESITKGSTTTITCPEGTQMPFVVGNRVTLTDANDSNWTTLINDTKVLSVDSSSDYQGYFQTRLTVEANTSGISTAFNFKGASLVNTLKVSAIPNGAAAGSIWVQQVQVSGDA